MQHHSVVRETRTLSPFRNNLPRQLPRQARSVGITNYNKRRLLAKSSTPAAR